MKRIVRKIAILLSMSMTIALLTSWVSCAWQLPSGTAFGADTASNTDIRATLEMLEEARLKALSDTDTTIDREKIRQEINESIQNFDVNAMLGNDFANLSPEEQVARAGVAVQNILETEELTSTAERAKKLKELEDRSGVKIDITAADDIIVSYVSGGKTYATFTSAKNITFESLIDERLKPSASYEPKQPQEHTHQFIYGTCITCGYNCQNEFHGSSCPECGMSVFTPEKISTIGSGYGGFSIFTFGSAISQGNLSIVFGIGGLAVGFLAAMIIFRKKKNTPALDEDTVDKNKENDEA